MVATKLSRSKLANELAAPCIIHQNRNSKPSSSHPLLLQTLPPYPRREKCRSVVRRHLSGDRQADVADVDETLKSELAT